MNKDLNIALIGRGKTGSHVAKLAKEQGHNVDIFHSENPPTTQGLKGHDIIIIFIPADSLWHMVDDILAAKIPIISGSTGVKMGEDFDRKVKNAGVTWIQGHNFSLGMNLVHAIIKQMTKANSLFGDQMSAHIHEIHHTQKKDAPSGTALRWEQWLEHEAKITSERVGDVVGEHTLTLETCSERISLTHKALDRSLFAKGALWAAQKCLTNNPGSGLHWFEDLALKELL